MRLLIEDYLGHAPQVQLSRALASRGHDVLHLYSSDAQRPKADLARLADDPTNLAIEGISLGSAPARSFLGQRSEEATFGRLVSQRASAFQPELLLSCNNPLDTQRHIQSSCTRAGTRLVYWLHGFYAEEMDRTIEGWPKILNAAVGSYYHRLERTLMQRSDAVVPIHFDYLGILTENWDIPPRQCMVVDDWFPLDRVRPGNKSNAWSRRVGLTDKKVAVYAGPLGSFENPSLLWQVAALLGARPDVCIVVVSEGDGADLVAREAKARGLDNLRVFPFQPYERYGDVLASADVLLAMVADQAGILHIPSKTTSYFCAGRPIVLSANWRSIASTSLRESKAGQLVPPDDAAVMAQAILAYIDDPELAKTTGAQARRYAEQTFDISNIASRFERLFERLISGPPRRH